MAIVDHSEEVKMCLAIPGKVIEVHGNTAKVDFGEGTVREVNVSLVNIKPGQYVLVHTGFAIQVMNEEDAIETIKAWESIIKEM